MKNSTLLKRYQLISNNLPHNILKGLFIASSMVSGLQTLSASSHNAPQLIQEQSRIYETDILSQASLPADSVSRQPLQMSIKTNALAWFMFVSNIGIEVEFLPRCSFSIPIYYSGVNYFTGRVKFRILGILPELRYSFASANKNGFVAGAHFGIAKYNFAIGGSCRFQDHKGKHPAIGGGVSIAYRLFLGQSKHWKLEFSAGAGYYHLYTDHYLNKPNGMTLYSTHNNRFIIDNVGVNFIYSFDLTK